MDQWKERLREHLGLGPKDIGQLGGGKKTKLTGRIDLATLQSLTRAEDSAAILSEYGLVIVDESVMPGRVDWRSLPTKAARSGTG